MNILVAVREFLRSDVDLSLLLGEPTGIHYDDLPQNATLPAIVLGISEVETNRHLQGTGSRRNTTIDIEILSDDRTKAATDISSRIFEILANFQGTMSGLYIHRVEFQDEFDDRDIPRGGESFVRRTRTASYKFMHDYQEVPA